MPFLLCPICGSLMHVKAADPDKWFAERFPGIPAGSPVPGICRFCWLELSVGDPVQIRRPDDEFNDQFGTITEITTDPKGSGAIYFVTMADESQRVFIRAHLLKCHEEHGRLHPILIRPESYC